MARFINRHRCSLPSNDHGGSTSALDRSPTVSIHRPPFPSCLSAAPRSALHSRLFPPSTNSFSQALSFAKQYASSKQSPQDVDLDEDEVQRAHKEVYDKGNAGGMSSRCV
jgi:hypothetical protein